MHERGYEHIHDPSALMESAKILYDSLENITAIHGRIFPVDKHNLIPVTNMTLDIGGAVHLEIFQAPGHAAHHLCIHEPESGCLFSGESLGHYHPESEVLRPAVAPPGFDYEASVETIEMIKARSPRTVCFSQYGYHRDPEYVCEQSKRQLDYFYRLIKSMKEQGFNLDEIIKEIESESDERLKKDRPVSSDSMLRSIVMGYEIYFQRKGKNVTV